MRKFFTIYEEAVSHYDFAPDPSEFSLDLRKFFFFFISAVKVHLQIAIIERSKKTFLKEDIFLCFQYFIQHCFICRASDSTVPEDAGIEPHTALPLPIKPLTAWLLVH
jgi:hypothetical protein